MWGKSGNFAAEMEGKFIRPCFGLRPRRDSEERNGDRLRETSSIFIRPCFGLCPRRDFEERDRDRMRVLCRQAQRTKHKDFWQTKIHHYIRTIKQ